MGKEMLRCAQHDSTDFGRETALSAVGAIMLFNFLIGIPEQPAKADNEV